MGKCEEQNQFRTKKKKKENERIQHTITTIKCVHVAAVAAVDDDDGNGAAVRHKSSRHFPLSRDDARALVNKPHWSCAEREIVFYFTPKLVSTAPHRTEPREPKPEASRSIRIPVRTFMCECWLRCVPIHKYALFMSNVTGRIRHSRNPFQWQRRQHCNSRSND